MGPLPPPPDHLRPRDVLVLGGGLVGASAAWLLVQRGHRVTLVAPQGQERSGSEAALGLLMADVFHRGRGRAWQLRQRSRALWDQWCAQLQQEGWPLPRRRGLLLLAADAEEAERQRRLVAERQAAGLPLEWWDRQRVAELEPIVPAAAHGGLFSPRDGQIDPLSALGALLGSAQASGMQRLEGRALRLERRGSGGWRVILDDGGRLEAPWAVVAAGLGSAALLAHSPDAATSAPGVVLEPVLGQALELEVPAPVPCAADSRAWPGALSWRGINLVPRPDRGPGRLWLGATLEPGGRADPEALERMQQLEGDAPPWLLQARRREQWQGCRCRPVGRPAPLLEPLAEGLLLLSGHYRNGVLLAPASAEWAVEQIERA
ncbi:MAG: NAD(P)/FAD-dependent oxidoreductase [Synechococcus sp.]